MEWQLLLITIANSTSITVACKDPGHETAVNSYVTLILILMCVWFDFCLMLLEHVVPAIDQPGNLGRDTGCRPPCNPCIHGFWAGVLTRELGHCSKLPYGDRNKASLQRSIQ